MHLELLFVNRTTVANRLPVTGGSDIIIAAVVLAMILSCGFMVFLNRGRREGDKQPDELETIKISWFVCIVLILLFLNRFD